MRKNLIIALMGLMALAVAPQAAWAQTANNSNTAEFNGQARSDMNSGGNTATAGGNQSSPGGEPIDGTVLTKNNNGNVGWILFAVVLAFVVAAIAYSLMRWRRGVLAAHQ